MTRTMPASSSSVASFGSRPQEGGGRGFTSVDLAVLCAVAEDRVDLLRPAAVELAVPLALLAHDAARRLEPDLEPDDLLQHADDRGMVDKQRGGAARHVALLGGQGLRVAVDADDLVADCRDLLRRDDGGAHEELPGQGARKRSAWWEWGPA